jgi:putative hydrolase of the HAD superfamily
VLTAFDGDADVTLEEPQRLLNVIGSLHSSGESGGSRSNRAPSVMGRARKTSSARIRCRAVFLDAGGVIVLPHRDLVTAVLARVGINIDGSVVARAHYEAVRRLDRDPAMRDARDSYPRALCSALGVVQGRLAEAAAAVAQLADRKLSGEIMWSEAAPHAKPTIAALHRAGIAVLVLTNSDGHAAENLRDAEICQTNGGPGAPITEVIDSGLIGSAKPDPRIFRVALQRSGVEARSTVHVGDMLCTDIAGARAAGIVPIHLDPNRACRSADHRHIRSLKGIWQHVDPRSA